mmetsp:Transcript_20361/g.33435  ORF Transcript_20361/g.33435 Transcript_20361/m.33435 type:complete len:85 (+) Transcript_20361:231-485(+)
MMACQDRTGQGGRTERTNKGMNVNGEGHVRLVLDIYTYTTVRHTSIPCLHSDIFKISGALLHRIPSHPIPMSSNVLNAIGGRWS